MAPRTYASAFIEVVKTRYASWRGTPSDLLSSVPAAEKSVRTFLTVDSGSADLSRRGEVNIFGGGQCDLLAHRVL